MCTLGSSILFPTEGLSSLEGCIAVGRARSCRWRAHAQHTRNAHARMQCKAHEEVQHLLQSGTDAQARFRGTRLRKHGSKGRLHEQGTGSHAMLSGCSGWEHSLCHVAFEPTDVGLVLSVCVLLFRSLQMLLGGRVQLCICLLVGGARRRRGPSIISCWYH